MRTPPSPRLRLRPEVVTIAWLLAALRAGHGGSRRLRRPADRRAERRRGRRRRRGDVRGRHAAASSSCGGSTATPTSSPRSSAAAPGGRRSGSTSARASTRAGRGSAPATAAGSSSPGCRSSGSKATASSRRRSTRAPTASRPPVPIDFNVGEATSTFPDLAMNRGGQAYLVYRVVTDTSPANPPGYVGADVRVARYNGRLWSVLGTPGRPQHRRPRCGCRPRRTRPRSGSTSRAGGVVAWQEPDDEFVDRVWARRLFGTSVGIPLQVSPSSWEGAPLRGPADAFSLDVAGFGQAAVAFRQQPGQASKLDAAAGDGQRDARRLLRTRRQLRPGRCWPTGASRGDLGAAQRRRRPARPLRQRLLLRRRLRCSAPATTPPPSAAERLDEGGSSVGRRSAGRPGRNRRRASPPGASCAAASGCVGVQERRADGVVEPTDAERPARGRGRAARAWAAPASATRSSPGSRAAAPTPRSPPRWSTRRPTRSWSCCPKAGSARAKVRIAWDHSPNAIGGVRYSVSVDDEPVVENRKQLRAPASTPRRHRRRAPPDPGLRRRRGGPGNRQPRRPAAGRPARRRG